MVRRIAFLFLMLACARGGLHSQFIQQGGKLIGPGALGIANQGAALCLSGDGSTAIVGGPDDSSAAGAAWVFVRANGLWIQQGGKMLGSGSVNGTNGARQGTSVAVSSDGNTAIIGGTGDNAGAGAAWVFTRTNGLWSQQGSKLVGTGAVDGFIGARQGESVALSADGNTAIVGGPLDSAGWGAIWIFMRTGGVWTQQGSKLVASTASGEALQGWSVALSGDGNTAIVGGIYDFNNAGAAWIFVRSGESWTQQGFKLYGLDAGSGANQGWAVALSYDGNTAVMGGNGDIGGTGATWIFTRSSAVWSQEGRKLVGTGASGLAGQGQSVSISSDGNLAMVGGPGDSSGLGAAWVFSRTAGTWSQQGQKVLGTGAINGDYGAGQGSSVALSYDGYTALAGGPMDNGGAGAVWPFTRAGSLWSQDGKKLVGSGARGNSAQGESVALSSDGNTVIVGGSGDSTGQGAGWAFTRAGGIWNHQGVKLVGAGSIGPAGQGTSVALSAEGTTAALGGPGDSAGSGSVWIFTRSSALWSAEGGRIRGTGAVDGSGGSKQGEAVSLSADGNTMIVGGPGDSSGSGGAWVFTRHSGSWTQQGSKLVGSGASGKAGQGASVSLSSDGNTAIVGGPTDSFGTGAAWVFTGSSGLWSQQGGKLTGSGSAGSSNQGNSVSLSSDGNTAIVGGPNDNSGAGASWVFVRTGGLWSQKGGKIGAADGDGSSYFGSSVSLAGDGGTAIVGGSNDNAGTGAMWKLSRAGDTWSQSGTKIIVSGGIGNPTAGESVSLSSDGNTFAAGGPGDNAGAGAVWVFIRETSGIGTGAGVSRPLFVLSQNYPNPFNPATTIRFELPSAAYVSLQVFNMLGEVVARLVDGPLGAGVHTVEFDASRLSSGVYVCALRAGGHNLSTKMVLIR